MKQREYIEKAKEHFGILLEQQFARIEKMKAEEDFTDYSKLDELGNRYSGWRWDRALYN